MFGIGYRADFRSVQRGAGQVAKRLQSDLVRPLFPAANYVRKVAATSIRVRPYPSPAGQPVHSKTKRYKRSIFFDVDRQRAIAVIGPLFSRMGPAAREHEQGGPSRGQKFPKRPTMGPARDKSQDKIAGFFQRK